ncbi:cryptochrome/photolyase family protein [Rhizobium sp. SSA_523]|uniref:cryptochrome/photolyase family protein n=1 Tax=Rhizobium sp. SSA_523 TaxID=2952477 RepID=UPI002091A971|nr:cryptochrome/photolyase family protein [Rhizobium sp. SSA_523]MCO5732126.1 cryptochrome/photolyase family protein [Rhizobium sp. SSA_523]WKC25628.1 cryptochrome/photolyase family protein [Rhizobium sp. SSA_523]
MPACRHLVFVLGDQLSFDLSSLRDLDPERDVVLMAEVMSEASYVRHHKQKIAFIFSAMRHFGEALRERGVSLRYVRLDAKDNSGSFRGELKQAVEALQPERIIVTEPGEWRVLEDMKSWAQWVGRPVEIREDDRFLCSQAEFRHWAEGRRDLVMEFFYREMRRKTGLLMEGDQPLGGRWNFDRENRKPAAPDLLRPKRLTIAPDAITREVLDLVAARFPDNIGTLDAFGFAVTQADAQALADTFMDNHLAQFGETQDAMLSMDPFLNHALLSFYINIGLLDPLSVCRAAERHYLEGRAPLNAVEGFIRQIIGWREYVRGVYWLKMPEYAESNFFDHDRPLPDFFWTGKTDMACLAQVVGETIHHAYAHHIQRLMVTGNFALLAGLRPRAVHEWYLEVYADAYEWVELPNVIGMSLFADGGLLGSKPYAASGNYIDKMSDYCAGCRYDVRKKTGEDACPFNALYWHFLDRHGARLSGNRRLAQPYATWRRMSEEKRRSTIASADRFLRRLDAGEPV